MAPAVISTGAAGAAYEAVSQNNVVLNCTSKSAVSYATVAVRFWIPPVPPNYANPNANTTQNCGIDASSGCTGALLQANLPLDDLASFTSMFPSGYGMGLFSNSASSGDVSIKAVSRLTGYIQGIFAGNPPTLSTLNAYPGVMAQLCAACGATAV